MYVMQWRLPAREGGDPYGNRTRVSAVKGPRPRPLDEGATSRFAWASLRSEAGIRRWLWNGPPPFRPENDAGHKIDDPPLTRPRRRPPHAVRRRGADPRSEEHTSELQSLMHTTSAAVALTPK